MEGFAHDPSRLPELLGGLRQSQFRCVARGGFGDSRNSYAHAMTSFRGRVFVGTTRNIFQLVKIAPDPATSAFHLWPVVVPPGLDAAGMDQRCQIWRYDPAADRWDMPFESPRVPSQDGSCLVWRDFGYRKMVVQQTDSDRDEALYVTTMSSSKAPGAVILRSPDGESFEPVTDPGLGDPSSSSFRAFAGFRGRLYVAPAGRGRLWAFSNSIVLECRDPLAGVWRPINESGFGDPSNVGVFEMGVFNDHLYAGVGNPFTGFQIWKTDCQGEPPYRWSKIVDRGAGRGKLNQAVMSMFPFQGALYVGTGIRRGGYDREYKIGPAAGEVIRIFPDDSWELLMGEERHTPGGDRQPLSGLGPGFDNPFNGYIWCMTEYDGNLYVGTYNNSIFLWWVDPQRVPQRVHKNLRRIGIDRIVEQEAGFDLWRTPDGERWFKVSGDGFGNPYNYGVRTLHGCESGLYVGTANPFGPEVAVRTATGWTYAANPKGGLEIWQGRSSSGGPGREPGRSESATEISDERRLRAEKLKLEEGETQPPLEDPLSGLAGYWSFSRFSNQGYWEEGTQSPREASETLMEKLLGFLPAREGRVLDVACGAGATSEYLARYFGPQNVIGIDLSRVQIESCKDIDAGCRFMVMSATQLEFEDESIDHVVCIEAASRFRTRERFLSEAYRVLKPGGYLLIADELFTREIAEKLPVQPPRNYVQGPKAYRTLLEYAGFQPVRVVDATHACALKSSEYYLAYIFEKLNSGEMEPQISIASTMIRLAYLLGLRYYVLAGAQKPPRSNSNNRSLRIVREGTPVGGKK